MKLIPHIRNLALASTLWAYAAANAQDEYIDEEDLFDDFDQTAETSKIADPLKGFNKAMFRFNDWVYRKVLTPVSGTYQAILPDPVEKGVENFFDNLGYPVRLSGNILQFKWEGAAQETTRFLYNSTVGFAGFTNPAAEYEWLNPPKEDIGQALGAWGIDHGFYIVLPFRGPTTLRDGIGSFGDSYVDVVAKPWSVVDDSGTRIALQGLEIVSDSEVMLEAYDSLTQSAINPYEAMKDAYIQYRDQRVAE